MSTVADTVDIPADTDSFEPAAQSVEIPRKISLEPTLDEVLELETASEITGSEPEAKSDVPELQELMDHEQESHLHLGGKIMLHDDANIKHPQWQDVEGFEIDLTIDFE